MELDFETVLDIALGGPEIGPLNLYVLHGLMKEVFEKFGLSQKQLIIEEEDTNFCDGYNFIKSKVDEKNMRPRTAGGGYSRDRSKVSVIVSDYARSPIGPQQKAEEKKSSLLPTDVEDRLRYIESELKIVKDFPSVDELRCWAQEKTSPDTVVTDLWHFVSLNHRMSGAEEGIQKLTELVDRLIPELKRFGDEQNKMKGQIDDLYSQLKALSDRSSRIDERIDNAGNLAKEKSDEFTKELKNLEDKMDGCAKLMDLEDFVLTDTFVEAQENAKAVAKNIQDELNTKAPLSMLDELADPGELKRLSELVKSFREQMENAASKDDLQHLELYVKWPQLEDALTICSSRPSSQIGKRHDSQVGSRPNSSSQAGSRPSSRHSGTSVNSTHKACPTKIYPSEACVQKLREIGMLPERQAALMDALEVTREQLARKADKSDLKGFLTQDDLNELLNLLRNLREEVNGLQHWRSLVDDEKVPALKALLNELEKQMADLLSTMDDLQAEDNRKQKAIEALSTSVDRLEENKLGKDDERLNRVEKLLEDLGKSSHGNEIDSKRRGSETGNSRRGSETGSSRRGSEVMNYKNGVTQDDLDDALAKLNKLLQQLADRLRDHENDYKKRMADVLDDLDDKLDRAELQPLREYLENRYNTLSQQQTEQDQQQTSPRDSKKHKSSPRNGVTVTHTLTQGNPAAYNPSKNTSSYTPTKGTPGQSRSSSAYTPSKGTMPYIHYADDVDCSHPHYGQGGFYPHKKEAAAVRTQMKFNCLSCDRPLTMQTNSHLQTIRGRPLNAYELDQLRLLQKILKGDNAGKSTRACGGKHTSSTPPKRITARINSSTSLPATMRQDPDEILIDGEVDIEGLDGRLYRGLISKKDLKNHSRSKSATAQLRTVSPRPISGKSVDFTSSLSSGLGTTHSSFDIQIE